MNNKKTPTGSLDIMEIVRKSYLSIWRYKKDLVKMSWVWLVYCLALIAYQEWYGLVDNLIVLGGTAMVLGFVVTVCIAPAWHQRLIGAPFSRAWLNWGIDKNALLYFWPLLILYLLFTYPDFMFFWDSAPARHEASFAEVKNFPLIIKTAALIFVLMIYGLSFLKQSSRLPFIVLVATVLIYLFSLLYGYSLRPGADAFRMPKPHPYFEEGLALLSYLWCFWIIVIFGLILPARGIGKKQFSFIDAKNLIEGHKLKLFVILILVELPSFIVSHYLKGDFFDPLIDLSLSLFMLVMMMIDGLFAVISLSALSYSYQALSEGKDEGENK